MIYIDDGSVVGTPEEITKYMKDNNIPLRLDVPVEPIKNYTSIYKPPRRKRRKEQP